MRVTVLTVLAGAAANAYIINNPEGKPATTTPCETSTVAPPPPPATTPCETSTVAPPPPPPASTPCETETPEVPVTIPCETETPEVPPVTTPCETETPEVPPVTTPCETDVPATTPWDTPVPTTMVVAASSAGGNWTEPPATTGPAMVPTAGAGKHAVPVLGSLAAVALANIFFL